MERSMKKNKIIALILVLILMVGVSSLLACSDGSNTQVTIDSPAPDFKLKDLDGKSVSLSSFLGKSVLLNFWATTCPPCLSEMPYLQEVNKDWQDKGLVMLAVNNGEDTERVMSFIQGQQYTFPVLLDSQYEVAGKYNVRYLPTSVFISKEGKIKTVIIGAFKNKAALEKEIVNLLQNS